jgi:hypothetical protein
MNRTFLQDVGVSLGYEPRDAEILCNRYDTVVVAVNYYLRVAAPIQQQVQEHLRQVKLAYDMLYPDNAGGVYTHPTYKKWDDIGESLASPILVVNWSDSDRHGNSYSQMRALQLHVRSAREFPFKGVVRGSTIQLSWN